MSDTVNLDRIDVWVCGGQTPRACELISTDCSFGLVGDSVIAERLLPSSGFPEARTQLHQGKLYSSPLRES